MVEITVAYYLGIDGGGSKTACAIGDEDIILASSMAGPSNITRVGEERARSSLHQAIRAACDAAHLNPKEINSACIGAAGAARADVAAAIRQAAAELIPGEIAVVGDMAIAMEAAFGAGPGVVVIAGTGSIAYGRNSRGETTRAGGWGFTIGDEGSAHWIGREAVSRLLRTLDERSDHGSGSPHGTPVDFTFGSLFPQLKAIWNVDSLEQLGRIANSNPDFSVLFPAVLSAADSGDKLALEVLESAAAELSRIANIVISHLLADSAVAPIAMVGGVFRHSKTIRQRFFDQVRAEHPNATLNPEVVEPVFGALQIARRSKS
ncbi:MAG TPA: BadF/BadG/BcrA/BcrD ATPase family protein [Candidatus Sulfotelmatobacter sp.]|jgi:glucosamine kinase